MAFTELTELEVEERLRLRRPPQLELVERVEREA